MRNLPISFLFPLILCLFTLPSTAQKNTPGYTISFEHSDTTLRQEKNGDILYEFRFILRSDIPKKLNDDSLFVIANPEKSAYRTDGYELSGNRILFKDLKKGNTHSFYLRLKKDFVEQLDRALVLKFETSPANLPFSNEGEIKEMTIRIKGINNIISDAPVSKDPPTPAPDPLNYPVSFKDADTILQKESDKNVEYEFEVVAGTIPDSLLKYTLKVEPDLAHSSLPATDYEVSDTEIALDDLKKKGTHSFSLTLKKDNVTDRERKLVLKTVLYNAGKAVPDKDGETQKMILSVISVSPLGELSNYQISFKSKDTTLQKQKGKDAVYEFILSAPQIPDTLKNAKLRIIADPKISTLVASEYELLYADISLSELQKQKKHSFFVRIKGDTMPDRDRELVLKIELYGTELKSENTGEKQKLTLSVRGIEPPLNDFNYLAYIGTNFDLVEGIKAKNLFFATNIYAPNRIQNWGVGFYLSLYGNRTLTSVDTSGNTTILAGVERRNDSLIHYRETSDRIRSRVSDNIGVYFSPLLNLKNLSLNKNTQIFYSPSVEFIWRRTSVNTVFSNREAFDTVVVAPNNPQLPISGNAIMVNFNEYNFNWSVLGFMIAHENKRISLRMHVVAVGLSHIYRSTGSSSALSLADPNYSRTFDPFFSGKVWITEATTGITLQAEVTNNLRTLRPYYGITLSKAFDFKHLGTLFQPITSR